MVLLINVCHIKSQCDNKLVQYKILLKTYWSRERFPKQYPQWSPSAQFGRLIGKFIYIFFTTKLRKTKCKETVKIKFAGVCLYLYDHGREYIL